jgi:hypothetical protein
MCALRLGPRMNVMGRRRERIQYSSHGGYSPLPIMLAQTRKAATFSFGCLGFATACGTLKDAGCDILVQRSSGVADIDWRRTTVFAAFGATFVGAWQYMLFTVWMQRLVPMCRFAQKPLAQKLKDVEGLGVAMYVCVENLFNQPLAFFPALYTIKHAVEHSGASLVACVEAGFTRTRESFVEDNMASCAVWVPATVLNGLFAPPWLRVPMMTAMGCGFTCFMSWKRGAPDADADRAGGQGRASRLQMYLTGSNPPSAVKDSCQSTQSPTRERETETCPLRLERDSRVAGV